MNPSIVAAELHRQIDILDAERDVLLEQTEKLHDLIQKLQVTNGDLTDKVDRYKEALVKMMSEIGVPQPGYPSPIANAYAIAQSALAPEKK